MLQTPLHATATDTVIPTIEEAIGNGLIPETEKEQFENYLKPDQSNLFMWNVHFRH